jgi:hypothetical protein
MIRLVLDPQRPVAAASRASAASGVSGHAGLVTLLRAAGNGAVAEVLAPTGPSRHRANPAALEELRRFGPARVPRDRTAAGGRADAPARTIQHDKGIVRVYDGPAARRAAARLGSYAYTVGGDVFVGGAVDRSGGPTRAEVLAHELRHVSQTRRGGPAASTAALEREADGPATPRLSADPQQPLGFWWVLPVAAAAYVLLRPNTANAPSPEDVAAGRLVPSVSPLQVGAEAMALFAVPSGVVGAMGRMGYGVIASFAVGGAASSVSYRGVQDVGAGQFSGVEAYVVDATTGAVIGVVVGGTFRAFGVTSVAPRAQAPGLVHLTDEAGQASIQASGVLRGSQGIYAVPESAALQGTAGRTARTLLHPAQTTHVVPVPPAAGGAFVRPVPVGPVSAYQYLMGVHRASAGTISMSTGAHAAGSVRILPDITGQIFPYGIDAMLWIAAATVSPAVPGAEERGLPSLGVPSLPYPMRDAVYGMGPQPITSRDDGPFILLPPAMIGLDGPDQVAWAAEQHYDPVAAVCLPSGEVSPAMQSGGGSAAGPALPAVIFVVPLIGG